MNKKITIGNFAIFTLVLCALFLRAPSARATDIVYEAHTPPTGNYHSSCRGDNHGLPYCNFTDTFSVSHDQLVTALTWYGLGCGLSDQQDLEFSYVLATADTFEVVAETTESAFVDCVPGVPESSTDPVTLAIEPTRIIAGQPYFLLLRSLNNDHVEVYWGVDAGRGSSFQVVSAFGLEDISQIRSDGVTPIPESGMVTENEVVFRGVASNDSGGRVRLQVELRRFNEDFTGEPTAIGDLVDAGQEATVNVAGLIDGAYRWKMRVADEQGNASSWQEFGEPGNSDLEIFVGPSPTTLPIPNPSCEAPVTFVSHAPVVLQSANFWTSCHGAGRCDVDAYSRVFDASGSELLAESDPLTLGFAHTAGASDLNYATVFSGANRITLQPGVEYSFMNFESNGNHCTDGPYHPDSAYLTVSALPGAEPETDPEPDPLPAAKRPTVLVPGILGSYLDRASDGAEVWPNASEMFSSASDDYLDDLALAEDGTQISGEEMDPRGMVHGASISVLGIDIEHVVYGDLVAQFTERGYVSGTDLFEVPYDWRMDPRTETARLASVMDAARAASPDGKVNIVAHSMGGLLVKQYLADTSDISFVDKVILAGVPQLGAPAMFKALNYGDPLGFKFPVINKDLLNAERIKFIVQNMPGAYGLLPSRRYVAVNGGYVKDFRSGAAQILSFDDTTAFMTADPNDSRNLALLSAAQELHDGLDDQPILGPDIYNLVACDAAATIGELRLYDDGKIDIGSTNGDGTVPLISAMRLADDHQNYFISSRQTGIDHAGLVKDDRTTGLIADIIEGGDISLPQGIGTASSICLPQSSPDLPLTLRFSSHSPVALHVYDQAGRHTGPDVEGGIETGIPGSSYTELGGNSFAFVPAGETYRVTAEGLAPGKFTLKAETLAGSTPIAAMNYVDVPLAGPETFAEAVFADAGPAPVLALDHEGDGIFDADISPTAELGSAAADVQPPTIDVSGVPDGSIAPGAQFTITFSASDDLSGVALVSATLDGVPFQSGDTFTTVEEGPYEVLIEAVDNAGNPRVFRSQFVQAESTGQSGANNQTNTQEQSEDDEDENDQDEDDDDNSSSGGSDDGGSGDAQAGQVLGETTTCLTAPAAPLGRGRINPRDQVVLLQAFLNREFTLNIPLTGFFGPITQLAVKAFQLKYYGDILAPWDLTAPTGFVGKYTLLKMGETACA